MGTHRNTGKKGNVLWPDYKANFSSASETNTLKIKIVDNFFRQAPSGD